jgi:hypothetical protein
MQFWSLLVRDNRRRWVALPTPSPIQITKGTPLRCILVNGAQLRSDPYRAACGERIGGSYVRQIGTRKIFCDFGCYQGRGDRQNLSARVLVC